MGTYAQLSIAVPLTSNPMVDYRTQCCCNLAVDRRGYRGPLCGCPRSVGPGHARTLSSIINGGATIMMAIFIDPHMSGMTDDVIEGKVTDSQFRKAIVWLVGSS